MNALRASSLLVPLLLALNAVAQERAHPDITREVWATIGLQGKPSFLAPLFGKDLIKRLRTSGEVGYRSADSFFAGKQVYVDIGAGYKVSDHVTVGSEFRYAYRSDDADRQRICALFQYKTTVDDRLDLGYRFDIQHNFRSYGGTREVFRNKFSAGYNIAKFKFDPQFSVEFFQWAGYKGLIYFGTRYKLGTEWSPWKGHTFGAGIMHDRERAIFAPTYRFMLALDYTINLSKI